MLALSEQIQFFFIGMTKISPLYLYFSNFLRSVLEQKKTSQSKAEERKGKKRSNNNVLCRLMLCKLET